jgi:hypothetical protein
LKYQRKVSQAMRLRACLAFLSQFCISVLHSFAEKINISALLEALNSMAQSLAEAAKMRAKTPEELEQNRAITDQLLISGSGTVLNILRNRRQGTALHVIVRHGDVSRPSGLILFAAFRAIISVTLVSFFHPYFLTSNTFRRCRFGRESVFLPADGVDRSAR